MSTTQTENDLAAQLQTLADEALAAAEQLAHTWRANEQERQLRMRSDILARAALELRRN